MPAYKPVTYLTFPQSTKTDYTARRSAAPSKATIVNSSTLAKWERDARRGTAQQTGGDKKKKKTTAKKKKPVKKT